MKLRDNAVDYDVAYLLGFVAIKKPKRIGVALLDDALSYGAVCGGLAHAFPRLPRFRLYDASLAPLFAVQSRAPSQPQSGKQQYGRLEPSTGFP